MIFEHDIFTFEVTREGDDINIKMISYVTEEGKLISLKEPCDMTYVLSESICNEAQNLIDEYEEHN
tara:strand:- start:328 stop:525 length:198 start_codon:yes stop_codon:yes gene_type:complete